MFRVSAARANNIFLRRSFDSLKLSVRALTNMTASIRILTTRTVDSSPAILLVDPDGSKTLINCGEGCQRSFLESTQKLASVNRVCLTHLSHDSVGGLPGMVLTSADAAMAAQVTQWMQTAGVTASAKPEKNALSLDGLEILGPHGTKSYVRSLRHFLRRDDFPLTIREGRHVQEAATCQEELSSKKRASKKKRKRQEGSMDGRDGNKGEREEKPPSYFGVQTIPVAYQIPNPNNRHLPAQRTEIISFVFTTPPVSGKFMLDKAKELGIPPGPLYAQLKAGHDVTFRDAEGKEQLVESSQVVMESTPGMTVAVLYYPTLEVWKELQPQLDSILKSQQSASTKNTELELIIHMTSKDVLGDTICNEWRKTLQTLPASKDTQHLFLETIDPAVWTPSRVQSPSPYTSACIGALVRSQISAEVYRAPAYLQAMEPEPQNSTDSSLEDSAMHVATQLLEYVMLPRGKKGFQNVPLSSLEERRQEGIDSLNTTGAINVAKALLAESGTHTNRNSRGSAELLFTGTGSAIPCKHRNVTGMCLRNDDGKGILLDVGEGTVGQLLRAASPTDSAADLLCSIKAAWVSHPHADHHLGLLRLLTDRQAVLDQRKEMDPLLLIGPAPVLEFLREYEQIDPRIASSYVPLDCRELQCNPHRPRGPLPRIFNENSMLGGTYVEAIQVTHCPFSYAIVLDGTSFGRVAYSGDCRPSQRFAERAKGADILIHEATFESGMEAEASMKRHSTVGEALDVAKAMQAKRLILTHFSQRYPKIPRLAVGPNSTTMDATVMPVIFAFDYMRLTPSHLDVASRLTPALRALYPEAPGDGINDSNDGALAMSFPGFFAQNPY